MTPPCPVCDSPDTRKLLDWKSDYAIHLCESCKVVFADPMPRDEELNEFYQGFLYRKPDPDERAGLVAKKKEEILRHFRLESSPPRGATFLDHGGGTGVATAAAREIGFDVYYHEIDEQAIEIVRDEIGIAEDRVLRTPQDLKNLRFDYVFSDNVIEHSPDPVGMLKTLVGLLNPGGTLIVKTPHGRNAELLFYPTVWIRGYLQPARRSNSLGKSLSILAKNRSWSCDPPRHLFSFSGRSLSRMASKAGVSEGEARIEHYRLPLFEYSLARMFFSKPKGIKGIARRVLFLPLVAAELVLKILQVLLTLLGGVSPGGVILRVQRR